MSGRVGRNGAAYAAGARRNAAAAEAVAAAVADRDPARWAHQSPTAIVSQLTGRTIWLNEHPASLAVPPGVTADQIAAAAADWARWVGDLEAHMAAHPVRREDERLTRFGLTPALHAVASGVRDAPDAAGLAAALGPVRALVEEGQRQALALKAAGVSTKAVLDGAQPRLYELLVLLWRHGLVALPLGAVWRTPTLFSGVLLPNIGRFDYGPLGATIREFRSTADAGDGDAPKNRNGAEPTKLLLSVAGAQHVGDLDSAFFSALRPHAEAAHTKQRNGWVGPPHGLFRVADRMAVLQRAAYPGDAARLKQIPQSYRSTVAPRDPRRKDPTFAWAARHGPRLARWREAAAASLAAQTGRARVLAVVHSYNALLDYVAEHADVPDDPLAYCRVDYSPSRDFLDYLSRSGEANTRWRGHGEHVRLLFESVLRPHRTDARYRNPIDADRLDAFERAGNGKTTRSAIPLRFMRMLIDILEDRPRDADGRLIPGGQPRYTWARTRASDYFLWRNPETGAWERTWSPVTVTYLLLRLHLPLRGYQARMLDSGEGDPYVYRPGAPGGDWVANAGPLAPPPARRRGRRGPDPSQGFVRRIPDPASGTTLTGFYVNTNKTADRRGAWEAAGYEIPWEHDEVLRLFAELRDWQERHNPIAGPMPRDQLHDLYLRATPDVARKLRPVHFLFRDPCNGRHPHEPLVDAKVRLFWAALLEEFERRLDAAGIRGKGGERIELVLQRDSYGRPTSGEYDLHSLRVAGLTHYAAHVPITVLSAFVAGHASAVMTYYYVKPGSGEVHDVLAAARAELARAEVEERDFAAWLRDTPLKALAEAVAYNDVDALRRLESVGPAGLLWMEHGVCPAGGALCHEGGPLTKGASKGSAKHGPVPGGPRNCPRCRFFLTGPVWRGALAAHYNAAMGALHEDILHLRTLEARERAAEAPHGEDPWSPTRWADADVRRAQDAAETQRAQVVERMATLAALAQLIEVANQAAARRRDRGDAGPANALVMAGTPADVEYALALLPTTDFDLWDRICASSEFYPSVNARMPAVHRGRLYDRMLKLNGQPVIFATLTPEEAVETGNALSRWLRTTVGDDDTNAVVAGRKLLAEVGLATDVAAGLQAALNPVPAPRRALPVLGRDRPVLRLTAAPAVGAGSPGGAGD